MSISPHAFWLYTGVRACVCVCVCVWVVLVSWEGIGNTHPETLISTWGMPPERIDQLRVKDQVSAQARMFKPVLWLNSFDRLLAGSPSLP